MNEAIGRLVSIGLARETTAGTYVSPSVYIPLTSAPHITQTVSKYEDESGIGRIEAISDKFVTKKTATTTLPGLARATSFGHILLGAFGTVATPALVETGVYKHDFSVLNNNTHPSYSFTTQNEVGQEKNTYNMLNSLNITAEVENPIMFSAEYMGKISESTSGESVAYVKEEPFKVSNMNVSIDGTPVKLQSLNLTIEKNVTDIFENGSLTPSSFHNQDFRVNGDIELVYRDDTFKTYDLDGVQKSLSITITGDSLIGATEKNELTIELPLISFDDWGRSDDNNALITQNFGITGIYSMADGKMITASLQNTQATTY